MNDRRNFLAKSWQYTLTGIVFLLGNSRRVEATSDPRPEFAANSVDQVLNFYFGTSEAADDASIKITAPLITEHKELVPFRIEAIGAEKIAVVTDANPEPLILAMEQFNDQGGVLIGRARLDKTGLLNCYAMRNGRLGRASQKITVSGHWKNFPA